MRRFASDDEENEWEVNHFFDSEEEENEEYEGVESEVFEMVRLELASIDINYKILMAVLRILEKTESWKNQDIQSKLKIVKETYLQFKELVQEDIKEEEK
jgi:hypothetical protein